MAHNRKIVISTIALTKVRNKPYNLEVINEIMDEIEQLMLSKNYLQNAPFNWVSLILRLGLKNDDIPYYEKMNKKYGDLPIAIELNVNELQIANRDELKKFYLIATLKALIHVGEKYNLPSHIFIKKRNTINGKCT